MKTRRIRVTKKNYSKMLAYVDYLIRTYQINTEKWIVDLFYNLSRTADADAVSKFENWITKCISPQAYQKIQEITKTGTLPEMPMLTISMETHKKLLELQAVKKMESIESTIEMLMECEGSLHPGG